MTDKRLSKFIAQEAVDETNSTSLASSALASIDYRLKSLGLLGPFGPLWFNDTCVLTGGNRYGCAPQDHAGMHCDWAYRPC